MKPAAMHLVLPAVIAAAAHEVRIFNLIGGKTHDPRSTTFVLMIWRRFVEVTSDRSLRLPPVLAGDFVGSLRTLACTGYCTNDSKWAAPFPEP